jgi:hypothetical protein
VTDPLQALLSSAPLQSTLFPPDSRYQGVPTATITDTQGEQVVYLRRRFLPQPEQLALVQQHTVVQGDRSDNLAQRYFNDPLLWWRLCDANRAFSPDELTDTVGRKLRITLPPGVAGTPF